MLLEVAVITNFLFVVIVFVSLAFNDRLWIRDFPKAMQAEMAPLTRGERLARAFFGLLLLGVLIGIPLVTVLRFKSMQGGISFLDGFLYLWLIFMSVNVVDLVIIDWLIVVWWQPGHSPPRKSTHSASTTPIGSTSSHISKALYY